MTEYLVFALTAPMGSFGGLAGHERRGSGSWPGRSAILGLLGAAQGVRRDDAAGQGALRRWQVAVSVLSEGVPVQDFHTVQTVPSANIKRPDTRRQALKALKPKDNPVITRRDYRCDCAFGVALWGGDDLDAARAALERPVFTPYLGRKSCPLAAPMAPRIVQAADVVAALDQVVLPPWLAGRRPLAIASDVAIEGAMQETVWDEPLDRAGWHFGPRIVHVHRPEAEA
ncbi:type I-E CRISPR-associated protein Cas5/CasD [Jhaorihella thermophila]|uniref:CRISPR system Cascade subunit CasD n=1 Tax=Jhaorihella thermophila TaxID=488547 RepID=A0A1H5YK24_9RHOB|nr:type I-E CRISPR-associated protein Cas5/CasD [Jhaorihella thermophila]SEG24042.1 CRISPR system Cascade subunit CasD [Jhaorihella thermophila]